MKKTPLVIQKLVEKTLIENEELQDQLKKKDEIIQNLLKQIEWVKQNFSSDIPSQDLDYAFITRNEAQRIQGKQINIILEELQKTVDEVAKLKEENKDLNNKLTRFGFIIFAIDDFIPEDHPLRHLNHYTHLKKWVEDRIK